MINRPMPDPTLCPESVLIRFVANALELGHKLDIRRCIARLHQFAERWWFPPLAVALEVAMPDGSSSAAPATTPDTTWRRNKGMRVSRAFMSDAPVRVHADRRGGQPTTVTCACVLEACSSE